jgi:hypothetical protein
MKQQQEKPPQQALQRNIILCSARSVYQTEAYLLLTARRKRANAINCGII